MNTVTQTVPVNRAAILNTHPLAAFAGITFALAWLPLLLTGIVPFFMRPD